MNSDNRLLSLGFSPCPNDTLIFNALVKGLVCHSRRNFSEPELADVETLNEWAIEGKLDVTKISFHALVHVLDKYTLLRSGSALGRGCGPLLVGRNKFARKEIAGKRIAIPGKYTTAAMLLKLYEPACRNLVVMRFDQIMPAVAAGTVDAGLIIHESRFTFRNFGLEEVLDLGEWWEEKTGLPIPLGAIVARRTIGRERISYIESCIRESVRRGLAEPESAKGYIRMHAQEMDDEVVSEHISLYVNEFTVELGDEGLAAVETFMEFAREAGLSPLPGGLESVFL
ncbi:MAG: 1,4-dihydroxy-6-naphthoate synthase [Proteobacteria bacterium]|nr:1,4-dihydroxy-6-naphthoate synthase [Pseudomonadota bacterium]MBU1738751.1 1,4-dihydroxy-6-naphthoate synthase [Pseudomonadota bacterium]